jgi:hypothetical protein
LRAHPFIEDLQAIVSLVDIEMQHETRTNRDTSQYAARYVRATQDRCANTLSRELEARDG